MTYYLELSQHEVHDKIPFQIIAETVESSRWNTCKRKRMQKDWFDDCEIRHLSGLKNLAHRWYLTSGVPSKGVKMSIETYQLWQKFALFCSLV